MKKRKIQVKEVYCGCMRIVLLDIADYCRYSPSGGAIYEGIEKSFDNHC